MNQLFYGYNLPVLRDHIGDEAVDFIDLRSGGGKKGGWRAGRHMLQLHRVLKPAVPLYR